MSRDSAFAIYMLLSPANGGHIEAYPDTPTPREIRIDWRPLLTGFRAIVDWPGAHFWRELSAAHPKVKVGFTVRDPECRYESVRATVFPSLDMLDETGGSALPGDVIRTHAFDGRFNDRAHCLAIFAMHNQPVCESISPDRLLVCDVREGWAPRCAFLGVPVPDREPFSRTSDTATF